jgi:hypothetical protein
MENDGKTKTKTRLIGQLVIAVIFAGYVVTH